MTKFVFLSHNSPLKEVVSYWLVNKIVSVENINIIIFSTLKMAVPNKVCPARKLYCSKVRTFKFVEIVRKTQTKFSSV